MNITNPLDIGIVVILGFCFARGLLRGFVKEVVSLIGILGGFYGACVYYVQVGKLLSRWLSHSPYLNFVSFFMVFVGVFISISLLGALIRYLMDIVFLGWIDRILGAAVGTVKGILIVSLLLLAYATFLTEWKPLYEKSYLSPRITAIAGKMARVIPKGVKREVANRIQAFISAWKVHT
ncbi:MAG: CvpA family protein [Deltaproteobacteria bacterium]|nr:CvpA family protein [Deltaproteobacteria bacterium]MBW1993271.1 CvpA family protein [Deltaproteobacteria bacterium]MBW2152870.1 CvpA family protein [Deltaproteobacteria bacterium]